MSVFVVFLFVASCSSLCSTLLNVSCFRICLYKYIWLVWHPITQALYQTVVVQRELSRKAKPSIYQSTYVPAVTHGHRLWVETERMRLQIQTAKIRPHLRVAGLTHRGRGEELRHPEGAWIKATAFLGQKASGIWSGWLLGTSLWTIVGHVKQVGDLEVDPECTAGIEYLIWSRNTSGSPGWPEKNVAGKMDVWTTCALNRLTCFWCDCYQQQCASRGIPAN